MVRHADVRAASRGCTRTLPGPAGWAKALLGNSMVNMDGPEHAAPRRIVPRRFTPACRPTPRRTSAGAEATRNAIARGLSLLGRNPERSALLPSDFDRHVGGAVEEIVRHSTPIPQFRRTVTTPCSLGGRTFLPGEKVALIYASANRGETVLTCPDVSTSPGPRIPISDTAAEGRTTAWAHIWPASKSRPCSENCSTGVPETGDPQLVDSHFDNRVGSLPFTFGPTFT
ncbi:hypothetical protein [Streptomyces pratensis]|uniref:hypothetical protein n=1 Tax=Streptomyces pratensis TaxID=1169025 RepID=UPI003017CB07